jgi:hypothetical protein
LRSRLWNPPPPPSFQVIVKLLPLCLRAVLFSLSFTAFLSAAASCHEVARRPRAVRKREKRPFQKGHLPEQSTCPSKAQYSGQAKHISGAAHASVPRTHALSTTLGVPTALRERAQRFPLNPDAPQRNGSACGAGVPLCSSIRKSGIYIFTPAAYGARERC